MSDERRTGRRARQVAAVAAGAAFVAAAALVAASPETQQGDAPLATSNTTLTTEEAREMVERLRPEVERLRGLTFKEPVPVEVVGTQAAREYMIRRIDAFGQRKALERMGEAYVLLQLLPSGTDLIDQMLGVMEQQAGGYYDPASGAYYLMDRVPPAAAPVFTVHELTHALEDQYHDLDSRLRAVLDDEDRLLARGAVHEGSATLLMTVYALTAATAGKLDPQALQAAAEVEAESQEKLAALPPVLARQLIGPYILGTLFLSRSSAQGLAQGFPAAAVERAYRTGPVSSEQILHPEKYWDPARRDEPRSVSLNGASTILGAGWVLAGHGTLGELSLGVLVGAATPLNQLDAAALDPAGWTNAAAAGWDGDRWELWSREGESVVLWSSAWDSREDAHEFFEALSGRSGLDVKARGERVAVVAGAPMNQAGQLLDRILAAAD